MPLKRQFPGFALRPVGTSDLLEHLGHKVVPRPNANAAAWQWSGTDSMMLQVVAAKSAVPGGLRRGRRNRGLVGHSLPRAPETLILGIADLDHRGYVSETSWLGQE